MKPSVHPTLKRLVATQASRTASTTGDSAAIAIRHLLVVSKNASNNCEPTAGSSRTRMPLHSSYTSIETQPNSYSNTSINDQSNASTNGDYYNTSSFETALNQVLRLKLDCPSRNENSHHDTMESCVRDFFKVWSTATTKTEKHSLFSFRQTTTY